MDEFSEHMVAALMMVVGSVSQWEETTDENLNDLESQLNTIGDAISCEREIMQAACEEAGGAASRADKNNATNV